MILNYFCTTAIEDGPVTNKADIWAFGLVLWEMIALSPPHVEDEDESSNASDDDSMLECSALDKSKDDPHSEMEYQSFLETLKDPDTSNYGL